MISICWMWVSCCCMGLELAVRMAVYRVGIDGLKLHALGCMEVVMVVMVMHMYRGTMIVWRKYAPYPSTICFSCMIHIKRGQASSSAPQVCLIVLSPGVFPSKS